MRKNSWLAFAVLGILSGNGGSAASAAVESVSETYAGIATYLEGSRRGKERLTYFSAQCVCPSVYAGKVTEVQGNVIVDETARWDNDQFNGSNGPFYVEFESGLMIDILDTDFLSRSLTLVGPAEEMIEVGDAYHVRRHMTVADMFGRTNEVGLLAGADANQADNIVLHVSELQETQEFYYRNQPGAEGWYRADEAPANDAVVFPEQGLILRRKGAGRVALFHHGAVKLNPLLVPISEGTNLVGTVKLRKHFRLGDLNLYTGDPETGLVAADTIEEADNVIIVNPVRLTSKTYYYSTNRAGREGWFDERNRSANRVQIRAGTAFYILRKPSRGTFYWSIPTAD